MPNVDVASINAQVLGLTFLLSVILGIAAQRSHFCTMGAVSDIVNMGDYTRMRMWAAAAGVSILGFAAMVSLGFVQPSKTLYASSKVLWLSAVVGGLMFGFGMVLASGCGNKTLLRIGAGSLKSLIVFVVMGVSAYATLKGITAVLRVATVDQVTFTMAMPDVQMRWIFSALIGGALLVWALMSASFRAPAALIPSLVIGAVIVAVWYVSGTVGFVKEHPDTLQEAFVGTNSGRIESLSFVAPIAYVLDWLMFFSDKSKVLTLGIVAVFGVIVGGFVDALLTKTFRWEGFGSVEDVGNHLGGAVLMGVGGVMAMGCTVGQGLSGISTLAPMSFVALFAIIGGAVAAFKYLAWRL